MATPEQYADLPARLTGLVFPAFERLRRHFTTWPTEHAIIEVSAAHLSPQEQSVLLALAVEAPRRRRSL